MPKAISPIDNAIDPNDTRQTKTIATTDLAGAVNEVGTHSRTSASEQVGMSSLPQPKYTRRDPTRICPEFEIYLKWKAGELSRVWPFSAADKEDLYQELRAVWLDNCYRVNQCESSERALLKTIVSRTSDKLRDKARTRFRVSQALLSSDSIGNTNSSADPRKAADYRKRSLGGQYALNETERIDLTVDVQTAIETLPKELAQLCNDLTYLSIAEISDKKGIPQSTLTSRVSAIRRRFEHRRLSDFL